MWAGRPRPCGWVVGWRKAQPAAPGEPAGGPRCEWSDAPAGLAFPAVASGPQAVPSRGLLLCVDSIANRPGCQVGARQPGQPVTGGGQEVPAPVGYRHADVLIGELRVRGPNLHRLQAHYAMGRSAQPNRPGWVYRSRPSRNDPLCSTRRGNTNNMTAQHHILQGVKAILLTGVSESAMPSIVRVWRAVVRRIAKGSAANWGRTRDRA